MSVEEFKNEIIMNDKEKNEFRMFLITVLEDFDQNKDVEIFATVDKIQDLAAC